MFSSKRGDITHSHPSVLGYTTYSMFLYCNPETQLTNLQGYISCSILSRVPCVYSVHNKNIVSTMHYTHYTVVQYFILLYTTAKADS
jgi:hypothetical protein